MSRNRKAGEPSLRGDTSRVVDRDPTGCRIRGHRCPPSRLWRRQTHRNRFACRQGSSWHGQLGDEITRPVRQPESRRPGSARRQRDVDGHSPDGSSTRGAIFKSVPVNEDVAGVDLYRSLKAWSRQRRRLGPPEPLAGRQGNGHQHDRDCRESPHSCLLIAVTGSPGPSVPLFSITSFHVESKNGHVPFKHVGHEGGTVVLEKGGGIWTATRDPLSWRAHCTLLCAGGLDVQTYAISCEPVIGA